MRTRYRAWCMAIALTSLFGSAGASLGADALSPAAQRGLRFTATNCGQCHAVDKISESPLKIAPPFRILHTKYPVENLRRPLSEGVLTNHPTMPVFRLDPGQVEDIIAYLKTLNQ